MRSMLGFGGAPARMMGDHGVPHHHQPASGTAAAAAAAGLLSRTAYRLAGFGGLLDARGRAQLAALAGFGVVVGGSPISHHHQHQQPCRPPHHQQMAPLSYTTGSQRQFLPPAPLFTPADLHLVLYGYARSRADNEQQNAMTGAHSLSGLRINELSYGTNYDLLRPPDSRLCDTTTAIFERHLVLRGGSAVGRWTCDLQVAGSIPGRWLSRNIGQLSLASLRGR